MADSATIAQLHAAIDKADASVLRKMLQNICRESAELRAHTARYLIVAAPEVASKKRKMMDGETQSDAKKACIGPEAVFSRYEKCITCDVTFDVTQNHKRACQTHEEEVEIDVEDFPDDDELMYGDIQGRDWTKDWRFKEFPGGFFYACYDGCANEEPCIVQRHIAAGLTYPLSSYSYSESDGSDSTDESDGSEASETGEKE